MMRFEALFAYLSSRRQEPRFAIFQRKLGFADEVFYGGLFLAQARLSGESLRPTEDINIYEVPGIQYALNKILLFFFILVLVS